VAFGDEVLSPLGLGGLEQNAYLQYRQQLHQLTETHDAGVAFNLGNAGLVEPDEPA